MVASKHSSIAVPSPVADNACAALQQAHDRIAAWELQHSDVSRELVALLARARADLAALSRLGNSASPDFQDHSRMNITIEQRLELMRMAACELEQLVNGLRVEVNAIDENVVALTLLDRADGIVHALLDIGQPDNDDEIDPANIGKRIRFGESVFERNAS